MLSTCCASPVSHSMCLFNRTSQTRDTWESFKCPLYPRPNTDNWKLRKFFNRTAKPRRSRERLGGPAIWMSPQLVVFLFSNPQLTPENRFKWNKSNGIYSKSGIDSDFLVVTRAAAVTPPCYHPIDRPLCTSDMHVRVFGIPNGPFDPATRECQRVIGSCRSRGSFARPFQLQGPRARVDSGKAQR